MLLSRIFNPDDKDDFAVRWCALTEPAERREAAIRELQDDIHSSDRIERLTSNPMLLTTLALVKRNVGKLPSRRAELYREAVDVLLNFRREVDEPIDRREALPQLEYVAYAMCDAGVQELREDQVLELLEAIRLEYPNIRPIREHDPSEFLRLLERRTGILVESGQVIHNGWSVAVFEFRHLTFQEFLAGLALVDGRFPRGPDLDQSPRKYWQTRWARFTSRGPDRDWGCHHIGSLARASSTMCLVLFRSRSCRRTGRSDVAEKR